jgi:4-amino-4-deoxy-L-arabinose transferase-like glycosyltransferase
MSETSVARCRVGLLAILAGAFGVYLIGNQRVSLWDRDEPRYAECSREMLRSGDWVVPRFLGELRAHKPPLIYWCQATAMELFGQNASSARLPSSVAAVLTAALLGWFAWRFAGPGQALWATLIFCSSALVIAAAKLCITDAVLLLWTIIGQGSLYVLWRTRSPHMRAVLLFWISTGLAGLTKGPVILAIHGGLLLVLAAMEVGPRWRSMAAWKSAMAWWRLLQPLLGVLILFVIIAPWIGRVNQRAPDFLPLLFSRAGKYASSGAEGHGEPPGYYLLLIWGLFFPWSILLPAAIVHGWKHRTDKLTRFALAATIGPWLVMELIINKLPFYVLPSFPGLAILTSAVVLQWRSRRVAAVMGIGMLAVMAITYGVILPNIPVLSASRSVAIELRALGAGGDVPVAMIDYREPSLAFYQGGGAREREEGQLTPSMPEDWAVLTTEAWNRVPADIKTHFEVIGQPRPAWMYSIGGRRAEIIIVHKKTS